MSYIVVTILSVALIRLAIAFVYPNGLAGTSEQAAVDRLKVSHRGTD